MPEEKKDEGFWAGLVLGGVLGAAAALLLGGEESELLKKKLKKKGKEIIGDLTDLTEEGREIIGTEVEEIKENVSEKVEKAEKTVKKNAPPSLRRFFVKSGKKMAK